MTVFPPFMGKCPKEKGGILSPLMSPLRNLRHSGESRNPEGRCIGDAQPFRPDPPDDLTSYAHIP